MPIANESIRGDLSADETPKIPKLTRRELFTVAKNLEWRELLRFAQVSRLHYTVASSDSIWRSLLEKYFPDANPEMVTAIVEDNRKRYRATISINGYKAAFKHFYQERMKKVKVDSSAFRDASDDLKYDKDVVVAIVRQNGMALKYVSAALRDDRDIVLAAVQQYGWALQYASDALRNDPGIVLAAVKKRGIALRYASDALRNDPSIVQAAVKQDGWALEYASDALRDDRDIVLSTVKKNADALRCASATLRNDRDIVLAAVKQDWLVLVEQAGEALKDDRDIVLAAVKQNGRVLRYASPRLQQDVYLKLVATPIIGFAFLYPEISLSLCAASILLLAGSGVVMAGVGAVAVGTLSYLACHSFFNQRPEPIHGEELVALVEPALG